MKKLKLTEHSLRQRIQSESKKLAAFSQQTTLLRAETMSMEHMIDEVTDALELSEAAHAKCAAETVSEEDRHNKAVIALEAKIEGKYSVHRKLSQEMQVLRQTALDHQSDLHLAWERTIYAQIANGMTPSKSQNESNIPPVLEFGCVEVKVETETKACEEEAQIIEDLKATLSSFKDQLDEMEERANTSSEKVELEQGAINNARKTEESRRDEASKFLIDIVTLRRENEHVRASFDTLRSLRDDQNAGIKRSIDTVRQENGQAEHNRSLAQHRLSKVATEVRSTSASALREKEAIALKLAEFESEISTVHQCNLSAKEELNRLSSIIESQDKLSRNSLGLSQSAAKKNIAEILNGKLCRTPEEKLKDTRNISRNHILALEYPDLESVRFGYDPKKTLDEQADESLKLIVAHCKHRLNSAKKMQAGLREAAKLEDLELREMQKAAAIESKRKFKIREYRKHRLLSGTSGNAIKQSNLKDEKKHKSRRSLQSMRVKASAWIGDEKTEKTRRDKKKMRREELQHQTEIALENSELNSVAKPRDLLEVFSRVGDDGGKSTYDLEACAVLTQTTAGSEKKVTWEEDNGKEKRTSKISKKDCTRGRKTKECLSKDSTEKPHIPKLAPSSLSATMLDAGFQEVSALLVEKEASSHRISSSKPVVQKSYTLPSVDRISREPRSQDLKKLLSCKSIGHTGEKTRSNSSRFGNPKKRDIDVTTNPRREMPHSFGSTKPISKTRGENAQSLKEWSGSSTSHRAFEDKTNSSKTKDQERRTTSHQREKGKRSHRSSADVRTASTDHKKMNYHLSLSHNSNPSLKRNSCQTSGLSSKERPAKSRRRLKSRSSDVLKNQIQTFGDERYSFGFATS